MLVVYRFVAMEMFLKHSQCRTLHCCAKDKSGQVPGCCEIWLRSTANRDWSIGQSTVEVNSLDMFNNHWEMQYLLPLSGVFDVIVVSLHATERHLHFDVLPTLSCIMHATAWLSNRFSSFPNVLTRSCICLNLLPCLSRPEQLLTMKS